MIAIITFCWLSCDKEDVKQRTIEEPLSNPNGWIKEANNPIFRDLIPSENYEVASDPHVFFDNDGSLKMIYSGDNNGFNGIKLATGSRINQWEAEGTLILNSLPSGEDRSKETPFYRKAANGKHQIYYIGYADEKTYQSQVYLAESDEIDGPYVQLDQPVIPRGIMAGKDVYLITSPSVVEYQGQLYMTFLAWNNNPELVSGVWVIGATSTDNGHTWTDFQEVDTKIAMEGQVTKVGENEFVAVRTGEYRDDEAIFYATATHPFGPWTEAAEPIITKSDPAFEKDEIIAPQITIDPTNGEEHLFYTGADHQKGWWIMLATKKK